MTISQARMISLINAALDYKRALDTLLSTIEADCSRARTNPTAAEHLLQDLASLTKEALLDHPMESIATLTTEYYHFKRNAARNERAAKKAALRRQQAGTFPRATVSRGIRLDMARDLPNVPHRAPITFTGLSQQQRSEIDAISAKLEGIDRELTPTEVYEMKRQIAASPITDTCPYCNATNAAHCRTPPCRWLAEITERERAEAAEADATFDDSQ